MIVFKSTYERLEEEKEALEIRLRYSIGHNAVLNSANSHLRKLNKDLEAKIEANKENLFSLSELKSLRRLCHPDRHSNSQVSTQITQKINQALSK